MNNDSRVVSMIQVSHDKKERNKSKKIDIYAIKRKTAGSTDSANSNINKPPNKKGKNRADGPDPHQDQEDYPIHDNEYQIHQMPLTPKSIATQTFPPLVVKKPRKKRQAKKREPVEVEIEKTWDKLRRTQVTMSVAEYLALNKKTSKDVKEGLLYIHRRKPIVRKTSQPRTGSRSSNPVVINALRSRGLLDEVAYAASVNTNATSMENFSDNSDSSDEEKGESGTSSENCSSSSETSDSEYDDDLDEEKDDDDSVHVNYPYNRNKMKNAQPARVYVSINNQLVEAVVDSGAAVSVCSIKLAKRLNLEVDNDEKIQLTGFGNKNVNCNIAPNVEVRIGGRKRVEHFCVDKTDVNKELCLLGRSWMRTHNISLIKSSRVLMVPINNGKNYIEVDCIDDGEKESGKQATQVPIYQVQLMKVNDNNNCKGVEINSAAVGLATYQEDIVSDSSFIQDNAEKKLTGDEARDEIPSYLNELIERNRLCSVEYNGLGRVSTVKHEIITLDDIPINSKPYRTTVDEDEVLKEQLKDLLELDIISPSDGK